MKGEELIKALRKKLDKDNNAQLAEHLGISGMHPRNLENQEKDLAPHQIAGIVEKAMKSAVARKEKEISKTFIKPIVEYFPIEKVESRGRAENYEIFPPATKKKKEQDEWKHVQEELQNANVGIYIFYDSSGRAIYVGKTGGKSNTLWQRMKGSFNHSQAKSRQIYRIEHSPDAKPLDKTLGPKSVQLHELAKYFSAYKVHPAMLHNVEALLVRAFADNLMNKKMETFKN